MKRLVINGLLLIGMLLPPIWFLNYQLGKNVYEQHFVKHQEVFDPQFNADVFIFGSSRSANGLNPKCMVQKGINAYNFAMQANNPAFYQKWHQHILKKYYTPPKAIIYEVDWMMFDQLARKRKFEYESAHYSWADFMGFLWSSEHNSATLIYHRFPFLKYRDQLDYLFKPKTDFAPFRLEREFRGFIPSMRRVDKSEVDIPKLKNDPRQMEILEQLVEQWQAEGIKVIFVQTPEYLAGRSHELYEPNSDFLHDLAQRHGIPFLDYNREKISRINADSTLFEDWIHLNEPGTELFCNSTG